MVIYYAFELDPSTTANTALWRTPTHLRFTSDTELRL